MKIGFLGDSITYGIGLSAPEDDRFTALICRANGYEECNYGIPGTLVARAGMSTQNGTAFVDRYPLLRGTDLAVIFGGTNDYFWTDTPIAPATPCADVRYFTEALVAILDGVREFLPKERILFVTPYPHHGIGNFHGGQAHTESSEHDTDTLNYMGYTLSDYSDAIVAFCTQHDIPVLDLRKDSVPFDWRTMTSDGCHPNPAGHRWLAERIGERIQAML